MPTFLPEGVRVPAGDDPYDLTNDLRRMMESATTVVPVTNTAARTALIAALVAAGRGPTADAPVYVNRADAGAGLQTEYTSDGTAWNVVRADDTGFLAVGTAIGFTTGGSAGAICRGGWGSMRGYFQVSADGGITTTFKSLGQLPVGTRPEIPTGGSMLTPMYSNLPVPVQGRILADGTVQAILLAAAGTTQAITTANTFSLGGFVWPVPRP